MRSSSGFNRSGSSFYPTQQQSQYSYQPIPVSTLPPYNWNAPQTQPGIIRGASYLHPDAGLPTYAPSRITSVPATFQNNYIGDYVAPIPSSIPLSQQSRVSYVSAPRQTVSTYANPMPANIQPVYKRSGEDGGYYNPQLFESSALNSQVEQTAAARRLSSEPPISGKIPDANIGRREENEVQLDRIRVFKKANIERVFGRDLTFDCNYEPLRLFSIKDLRGFIVNGFEDFEKNLRKLESSFTGLEQSFFHLLHKAESPKDIFDRFLVALDKRVERFFAAFDEAILQNRGLASDCFDVSVMRNDYEFMNFRAAVKQGVVEISNKLNDYFISRDNSAFYDAQVIRCLETIIKLYNFLKCDFNTVLHRSLLRYAKILEVCTYNFDNGEILKALNFADFVQLDIASLVASFSEELDRTYPVLLSKKQISADKFHEILRDKSPLNQFDLKSLVRSIFSRERRKVYRTIYNMISKNGKDEFELNEDLLGQNKRITEKMNRIKSSFLSVKGNQMYLEVMSGRMNIDALKNSPTLFEENSTGVLILEQLMVQTQELVEDIRNTIQDIIYYKDSESAHYKELLDKMLNAAVYELNQQEKLIHDKGDMSEFLLYQFKVLENSLYSDNTREDTDQSLDSTLKSQLKKNAGNVNLHSVAADFARTQKDDAKKREVAKETQARKAKEYQTQIADYLTGPMIDKPRNMYPVKEDSGYERSSKGDGDSSKDLATKLLESIQKRREEDLEKDRKLREEQEEIRIMKEIQTKEENERMQQERKRQLENTDKRYKELEEQRRQDLERRAQQRAREISEAREADEIRATQQREAREQKKREEDERREQNRQINEEQKLRKKQEEDERKQREQEAERIRKEELDFKRKQEDEERRKAKELNDFRKKQEDEDKRAKEEADRKKREEAKRIKDEEDRKKKEEADQRRKDEEDRRKREDEEKKRLKDEEKRKKEEADKIRQAEEAQRRQEEDERRKIEEADRKLKKEENDRKLKKEENDRKLKKEEDDRKLKKEEDDRKAREAKEAAELKEKREAAERKRKEEEDQRKKEEEIERKRKEEERERKRKEEEEERKRKKEEEDEKRRKKEEDDKRKKQEEEAEKQRELLKIKEQEEKKKAEELKRKADQEAEEKARAATAAASQAKKSSGFNYDSVGNSDVSYHEEIEDNEDDAHKDYNQDQLYENIPEDSGNNFNDDIMGAKKPTTNQIASAAATKPATAPSKKVNDDLDFDFDDFDESVKKEDNKKPKDKPSQNVATNANNTSKKSLNDGYDEDFEIEEDFGSPDKEDNKKGNGGKEEDDNDGYDFDFEDSNKKEDEKQINKPSSNTALPKPTGKTTVDNKKKTSAFDYDLDLDDEDDEELNKDEKQLGDNKKDQNKVPPKDKGDNNQKGDKRPSQFDDEFDIEENIDDDFGEEHDGLEGQPGQKQQQGKGQEQGELTQEQMEQLMQEREAQEQENYQLTYDLIAKTNEYVKKTRFGRSNHVNLSKYNSYEHVHRIYEEFVANQLVFLFDIPIGDKLIDLFETYSTNPDDFEPIAEEFAGEIQKIYYDQTQSTTFHPETKLYFALQPNQFGFQLIEVNLAAQRVSYFYMIEEADQELINQLNDFHEFFQYVLSLENFQASPSNVEDSTLKVLQIYEKEPHLQYMIMLFPLVYEFMSDMSDIVVDQNTIDRIFYIQLAMEGFYAELETNPDGLTEKFTTILENYQQHPDFEIANFQLDEFSEESMGNMIQTLDDIKKAVLEGSKKYGLVLFDIQTEPETPPASFYFYVSKSEDPTKAPHEVGILGLTLSGPINEQVVGFIQENLLDETTSFNPHIDNTRHNGLYEYAEMSLPIWAHLIDKKKLPPFVAINILNFSLIPYHITYKGLD